ncbi:hypothetical protein LAZ67_1005171 [Cordylochernes scorpioides]|uniref:Uncharacterized protein n=1 Tax=Cordylochernes scorpioides TaxID=51811 RepID=A0ABY6JXX3_9ARAC|nr:hypothetical protein LAZ67_1005171 [Cordylochernes scorpioides]
MSRTFIPYPLVFGALTDAACLVWEEKCGETGNCWLYDSDKFRYYLHGLAAAFIFLGSLFEIGVYLNSHRVTNFYTDDVPENIPAKDKEASQPLNPSTSYDMIPLK